MKNIQDQVSCIQEKMTDRTYGNKYFLRYSEEGYTQAVTLVLLVSDMRIEVDLWNSENEERKWIEKINDYESFETLLVRKIKDSIKGFKGLQEVFKD